MTELIDRVAFRAFWNKNYRHQYANDTFLFAIANFPTTDAVPVVRCKDCKHWDCGVCDLHSEKPDEYCTGLEIEMFADDFCSYGERKVE